MITPYRTNFVPRLASRMTSAKSPAVSCRWNPHYTVLFAPEPRGEPFHFAPLSSIPLMP